MLKNSTAVTFVASLFLIPAFHTNVSGFQLVERASWIPSIGAQYLIGIDGISLVLIPGVPSAITLKRGNSATVSVTVDDSVKMKA